MFVAYQNRESLPHLFPLDVTLTLVAMDVTAAISACQLTSQGILPDIRAWVSHTSGEVLWPIRVFYEAAFGDTSRQFSLH